LTNHPNVSRILSLRPRGDAGSRHQEGNNVLLAADPAPSSGSSLLGFLPILLIGAAMYFLLIRPQSKRRRDAAAMQATVGPGDEVQTLGGLYGTVTAVDDESVNIEAAPGVVLRFARGAVGKVITKQAVEADEDENADAAKTIEQN